MQETRIGANRRNFLAASGAAGAATLVGIAKAQPQNASGGPPATEVVPEFLANTAEDKIHAAAERLVAEDATYISRP